MHDQFARVNQLYSDYCFAMDKSDGEAFAECFSDDAVFEIVGKRSFEGREAMQSMVAGSADDRPRHHFMNLGLLEASETLIRSRAYFFLVNPVSGVIDAYGEYEDDMTPTDNGGLVFQHRRVKFLWISEGYGQRLAGVSGS